MKAIVCELCGSNELVKEGDYFICQHCGTKYGPEEAKRLVIQIDNSANAANYCKLGDTAREARDWERAAGLYSQALVASANCWPAVLYYQTCTCRLRPASEAGGAFVQLSNIMASDVVPVAVRTSSSTKQAEERLDEMMVELMATEDRFFTELFCSQQVTLEDYDSSHVNRNVNKCIHDTCMAFLNEVENGKHSLDKDELRRFTAEVLRRQAHNQWGRSHYCDSWIDEIAELDSSIADEARKDQERMCKEAAEREAAAKAEREAEKNSGGCYVATCVYGSYDCPQVWTLRRFRDCELAQTRSGRAFIKLYYLVSPKLVSLFGDTVWFNKLCRGPLDRLVRRCRARGYADTPYEDRVW